MPRAWHVRLEICSNLRNVETGKHMRILKTPDSIEMPAVTKRSSPFILFVFVTLELSEDKEEGIWRVKNGLWIEKVDRNKNWCKTWHKGPGNQHLINGNVKTRINSNTIDVGPQTFLWYGTALHSHGGSTPLSHDYLTHPDAFVKQSWTVEDSMTPKGPQVESVLVKQGYCTLFKRYVGTRRIFNEISQ